MPLLDCLPLHKEWIGGFLGVFFFGGGGCYITFNYIKQNFFYVKSYINT